MAWLQVKTNTAWPLPQVLCYQCSSTSLRQGRLQVKGSVAGLVSILLFWQPAEYLPATNSLRSVALCRHQFDLSTFNQLCGCCPQKWQPTVHFQRVTLCPKLTSAWVAQGSPKDRPAQQLNLLQPCPVTGSLACLQKTGSSKYVSPIIRSSHQDHPHSFKSFYCISFPQCPTMPPIAMVSPHALSFHPISLHQTVSS